MALHLENLGKLAAEFSTHAKLQLDLAVSALEHLDNPQVRDRVIQHLKEAHHAAGELHRLICGDYDEENYRQTRRHRR